jgi:hypothetical protein
VLHPYGSDTIELLGPSPVAAWRTQLNDLDRRARDAGFAGFGAMGVTQRMAIVRDAVGAVEGAGMPTPLRAKHVAVALMAHYYGSPEATDLCYEVQIRREQCRPLRNAARAPIPLTPRSPS